MKPVILYSLMNYICFYLFYPNCVPLPTSYIPVYRRLDSSGYIPPRYWRITLKDLREEEPKI